MSYILDALKKSDRERQRGAVPDLQTVQDVAVRGPGTRFGWLAFLLSTIVLLVVGLSMIWLSPWKAEGPTMSTVLPETVTRETGPNVVAGNSSSTGLQEKTSETLPAGVAGETADVPQGQTETAFPALDAQAFSARKPGHNDASLKPVVVNNPEGAQRNNLDDPVSQAPPIAPVASVIDENPSETAGVSRDRIFSSSATAADEISNPSPPPDIIETPVPDEVANRTASPAASQPLFAEDLLPDYMQLPYSMRQELPKVTISVHFYAHSPASRKVNVNGRMMREGQYVSPVLKLEQITVDGVIFDYKGRRFEMSVF